VAAIRHVTTGTYLKQIRHYESLPINPEFDSIRKRLITMTNLLEHSVERVNEAKSQEYIDFHARRLVEMAGHIIMSYLLIIDATRDKEDLFRKSAFFYINLPKWKCANTLHSSKLSMWKVSICTK
jgi:hypothetical protein